MSKRIKLIHNRKENESSYYYGFNYTDKINNNYKEIIDKSIQELSFDKNRKLKIYTWGEKNKDTNFKLIYLFFYYYFWNTIIVIFI